ncbi:MAG TPA: hypothetical protein VFW73_02300 [Lacipirellulaceae bacterium]|nr:hypothetical protein [Lacipirellulaceae bacterium]
MLPSTEQSVSNNQPSEPDQVASVSSSALAKAVDFSKLLEPDDQLRLISTLWLSLPPKTRAVVLRFELDHLNQPREEALPPARLPQVNPVWPAIHKFLFDPSNTSELFSAPRRFDLATIFVVTAAFSLLFGAMSAMDFGPITEVIVGVLITVVAAAQAYYQHSANPRGVSVAGGAITLAAMLVVVDIAQPRLFSEPRFVVVVIYGICGGAICGYLAGVLVGGVFLVADVVRRKYTNRREESVSSEQTDEHESCDRGESPWAD